ncbi:uncharacterized protein [Nicotiana sylvestris]|uniref:uncharacterized protein n=1 Tax=Nicotiana sylvestris TaxID=4096 RepID=UPI00388CEABC
MLRLIESKFPNPPPKNHDYSVNCEYCSGTSGHDTEKCWHIKNAIQELIDTSQIEVQTLEAPNINHNTLLTHEGTNMIEIVHKGGDPKKPSQTVMMIRSNEVKPVKKPTVEGSVNKVSRTNGEPSVVVKKRSPSDVATKEEKSKMVVPGVENKPVIIVEGACTDPVIIKSVTQLTVISTKAIPWNYERYNPVLVKKAITKDEAEEFLRKMKVQDYFIMEQLRKMPAQISLLSLLIHSDKHRRALIKILNEAHFPDKILVNHLEKIANKIFEVNRVTFSDDELLVKGTKHNKDLYFTVKCEDSVVTRVLVDNGSSANICPVSTLNKLTVDDNGIHKNSICVRVFDGGGKDSIGRTWIHAAKAVSSTLHQMVMFEWDRQEIIVHGENNLCAHRDTSIPFIEAKDDKGPWVYQVFETVLVEKVLEGKFVPTPKITSASVMVATKMLKNGFVPGKGLGASLQGIIQLVSLPKNLGTFGVGFKPTAADMKRAKRLK